MSLPHDHPQGIGPRFLLAKSPTSNFNSPTPFAFSPVASSFTPKQTHLPSLSLQPEDFTHDEHPRAGWNGHRVSVLAEEVCPGAILWWSAPQAGHPKANCVRNDCEHCKIDLAMKHELEGRYNHPAVVLRVQQRRGSTVPGDLVVHVSDMTTFAGTPLSQWIKHSRLAKMAHSIPVRDRSIIGKEAGDTMQLELDANSISLTKFSYIRLQHIFEVPIAQLSNYCFSRSHAWSTRLSEHSTNTLMHFFGLACQEFQHPPALIASAQQRLTGLAQAGALSS